MRLNAKHGNFFYCRYNTQIYVHVQTYDQREPRIKRHLMAKRWHGVTWNVQNDHNIAEHSVTPAVSNNMLYLEFDIISTAYYTLRLPLAGNWIWKRFFFLFSLFFFLLNSDSAIVKRCDSKSYPSLEPAQKDLYTKLSMLLFTFLHWLL